MSTNALVAADFSVVFAKSIARRTPHHGSATLSSHRIDTQSHDAPPLTMLTFRLAPGSSLFVRLALCSALCNVGCKNSPTATTDAGLRSDADEFSDAGVDLAFDSSDDAMVADTHRVLFVGNSYVYVNDVSGHYRDIAQAFLPDVDVQAVATGGYTLAEHAADANTNGTSLAACLGIESDATTQFDAVVLQEQSQLGGYPSSGFYSPERAASVDAAGALSAAEPRRVATAHPAVRPLVWSPNPP